VAAAGEDADALLGREVPAHEGIAGFVATSSQPLAFVPRPGDQRLLSGLDATLDPAPQSILCVPCSSADATVGVLQVIDKRGGGQFSFDDLEVVTLLAGIAGVAITQAGAGAAPPPPGEVAGDLAALATAHPARYAAVASLIGSLADRD
jgi:GAF domain-containing protein